MYLAFFKKLGLFIRNDFLDAGTCALICDEMRMSNFKPAAISSKGVASVDESHRSTKAVLVSKQTRQEIKARFIDVMPDLESHFRSHLTGIQPPQFLRYGEDDFFGAHADNDDDPQASEVLRERKISAVLLLNPASDQDQPNTYTGGRLTFYGLLAKKEFKGAGLALPAETGILVAFPSDTIHQVSKITRGERFSIVCWYH